MSILILGLSAVAAGAESYNNLLDRLNVTDEVVRDGFASLFVGIPGESLIYSSTEHLSFRDREWLQGACILL